MNDSDSDDIYFSASEKSLNSSHSCCSAEEDDVFVSAKDLSWQTAGNNIYSDAHLPLRRTSTGSYKHYNNSPILDRGLGRTKYNRSLKENNGSSTNSFLKNRYKSFSQNIASGRTFRKKSLSREENNKQQTDINDVNPRSYKITNQSNYATSQNRPTRDCCKTSILSKQKSRYHSPRRFRNKTKYQGNTNENDRYKQSCFPESSNENSPSYNPSVVFNKTVLSPCPAFEDVDYNTKAFGKNLSTEQCDLYPEADPLPLKDPYHNTVTETLIDMAPTFYPRFIFETDLIDDQQRIGSFYDRHEIKRDEIVQIDLSEPLKNDEDSNIDLNNSNYNVSTTTSDIIDVHNEPNKNFVVKFQGGSGEFNPFTDYTSDLSPHNKNRTSYRRRDSVYQQIEEKRRKLKLWCKKLLAFLISHVGLISLVTGYSILGGLLFQNLEQRNEPNVQEIMMLGRSKILSSLRIMHNKECEKENFTITIDNVLVNFQRSVFNLTKNFGWNGNETSFNSSQWMFSSSLLYSITVITTIGYGHVAPKTTYGRLMTIVYATIGIPLTLLCLNNIGNYLASGFRFIYGKICRRFCTVMCRKKSRHVPDFKTGKVKMTVTEVTDRSDAVIHVPTYVCLIIIITYINAGAILFSTWEGWDHLKGCYFCFITLSTIGFGDVVPGANSWKHDTKLVLCAVYVLLGLSLIAMCFTLVQEDVKKKSRLLGRKVGLLEQGNT